VKYQASLHRFIKDWFDTYVLLNYQKGQVIIHEDEEPKSLFLVESGYVKAYTITKYGERNVLEIHRKGDIFSLPALLERRVSGVYYEAATAVQLRRMPKEVFYEGLERSHMVTQAVIWQTLSLLNVYSDRIQNLAYRTAKERIVARLLFLVDRFGKEHEGELFIDTPITHQELADSLSITRETATRMLDELKRKGLLDQRNRQFVILDEEGLRKLLY
jgi:CRP/FNR family transcriptional regulator, cyclic AMP receptor protein